MNELFIKFDDDKSKIIEFGELRENQWWIEVFFEGQNQFRLMDQDNNTTISFKEFKHKLPDLYLPPTFPESAEDQFKMFNPVHGEIAFDEYLKRQMQYWNAYWNAYQSNDDQDPNYDPEQVDHY